MREAALNVALYTRNTGVIPPYLTLLCEPFHPGMYTREYWIVYTEKFGRWELLDLTED